MKELEEYSGLKFERVSSYFWSHAYHLWLTTPYFDLEKAVKNSIMPNPILLANFGGLVNVLAVIKVGVKEL